MSAASIDVSLHFQHCVRNQNVPEVHKKEGLAHMNGWGDLTEVSCFTFTHIRGKVQQVSCYTTHFARVNCFAVVHKLG